MFTIFMHAIHSHYYPSHNMVSTLSDMVTEVPCLVKIILQEWSGQRRIIRVMPNTPAAVGQAASGEICLLHAFIFLLFVTL